MGVIRRLFHLARTVRRVQIALYALAAVTGATATLGGVILIQLAKARNRLLVDSPEYADDTPLKTPFGTWDGGLPDIGGWTRTLSGRLSGLPSWIPLTILAILIMWALFRLPMPNPHNDWPTEDGRDPRRDFTESDRWWIMECAGYRCEHRSLLGLFRCRRRAPRDAVGKGMLRQLGGETGQLDHHYPHAKGGATTRRNLVYLCARHNRMKSDRTPTLWDTWMLERARLKYFPRKWRAYARPDARRIVERDGRDDAAEGFETEG